MGPDRKVILQAIMRSAIPLGVLFACLWLLRDWTTGVELETVVQQLSAISALQWLCAALATAASFWAVSKYDVVAHRHFGTGVTDRDAQVSGAAAIAIAQVLGFAALTGALARWRVLRGLSVIRAAHISLFVSVSFVFGWSICTAIALVTLPGPGWAFWPAAAMLIALPLLFALTFCLPNLVIGGRRIDLPSLRACVAIPGWACLDLLFAAVAFFVLLPASADLSFAHMLPLFLLALGAALITGAPGGVGPFEVMLLALLPTVPVPELMSAMVAFRAVYYIGPACCASLLLVWPRHISLSDPARTVPPPHDPKRAETGILAQNGGAWRQIGAATHAIWPTRQTLTSLFDPEGAAPELSAFKRAARTSNRIPVFYKLTARTAAEIRRAGWNVMHMADEAVLPLAQYRTDMPARRTLRRKLRHAERAGLRITAWNASQDLGPVDDAWQALHERARGGTMGRYCPAYIAGQAVYCATMHGEICGFVTFHTGPEEWTLDLMRHTQNAPDGTMHLLVHHAVLQAKTRAVTSVCLAAITACPNPYSRFFRFAARIAARRAGGPGLRQFKSSFAPNWRPVYMAAPGPIGLTLAALDIAMNVNRPTPLPEIDSYDPHNQDENNEFASRVAS